MTVVLLEKEQQRRTLVDKPLPSKITIAEHKTKKNGDKLKGFGRINSSFIFIVGIRSVNNLRSYLQNTMVSSMTERLHYFKVGF
jgi:hypothetical protein